MLLHIFFFAATIVNILPVAEIFGHNRIFHSKCKVLMWPKYSATEILTIVAELRVIRPLLSSASR
jgi:hypothetical protein